MPESSNGGSLKDKLSSRKFWIAVIVIIVNFVLMKTGSLAVKAGMANVMWVAAFYLLGQGIADSGLMGKNGLGEIAKSVLPLLAEVKALAGAIKKDNGGNGGTG